MMRHVKASARLVWKVDVLLCVFLISSYIVLMSLMAASNRFDAVQLPNGAYMTHRAFLPWKRHDIVLRHPDGTVLVNESIDLVCFNEQFVTGSTLHGPRPSFSRYAGRFFIYEKGEDEAVFNIDPRYHEVEDRSGLRDRYGCGIERAWKDFYILHRDPEYRR